MCDILYCMAITKVAILAYFNKGDVLDLIFDLALTSEGIGIILFFLFVF